MTARCATCSCGQLTATTAGEPIRISVCHCFACQRRTGSVFGVQTRFPRDAVSVSGRATTYLRTADSGNRIRLSFCPDCGSTVFYVVENDPNTIAIPVGAFADPGFPTPTVSVYESRRHSWVEVPEEVEHFE